MSTQLLSIPSHTTNLTVMSTHLLLVLWENLSTMSCDLSYDI